MASTNVFAVSTERLQSVLQQWQAAAAAGDAVMGKSTAMVCVFGERDASSPENQRGEAMLRYLLDAKQSLENVAAVITKQAALFIHAGGVTIASPAAKVENYLIEVAQGMEAAQSRLTELLAGCIVGAPLNEFPIQQGDFAAALVAAVKAAVPDSSLLSASPALGELLLVKDATAISCVEKAAGLCCAVFRRYARDCIAEEMSKKSPKSLYEVRQMLCDRLLNPTTIQGLESLSTVDFSAVTAMPACLFHMGTYKPQLNLTLDTMQAECNVPIHGDVVVLRYGVKNSGYTAFFGRTLLVESAAPSNAKAAYQFVYDVSAKLMELLVPGSKLSAVYEAAIAFATELSPELATHLAKNFGFSTGLLVLEVRGTISEKGTATIADGMTLVTRVVLEAVPRAGAEGTFDVELTDTVVVRNGVAELKTKVARKVEEILFQDLAEPDAAETSGSIRDLSKITRQGQTEAVIISREAQRARELQQLLVELHEEFVAAGGKKGMQISTEEYRSYDIGRLSFGELNLYKPDDRLPPAECEKGIFVQVDKKVVWLPVFGRAVPFHVSTISKVDVRMEGAKQSMTVIFHSMQEANVGYKMNRTKVFVKELTYTGTADTMTETQIAIQGIQQRIKNDDAGRKRSLSIGASGKLTVVPNPLQLPQVKMRPPMTTSNRQNKSCVGNLQLHANGLRFTILGAVPVDLLFDNVQHIIFQPAVKSIYVIYHVTLKKPIEINRKNVTEVQFVAEVMESSELASGGRSSYEEEVNAELREENRIRETNKQFITFASAVRDRSNIKTQLPTNQFSFDGVHARSMTAFKGNREVLWAIADTPAFTQSVDEVEVVSFERVIAGGVTFDMSLIMKNYNKPVITISSIPRSSLEHIKDWCLSARLYYMETAVNPNWRVTMKDIREDPEWQPWQRGAGWSVLNEDDEDEEEEDSDSDATYQEDEEEETSDSDDSSWLEDEESVVDSDSDDSDESSDVSWDELDRRAEAKDRRRQVSDDDDDDRPHKRARGASGASSPPAGGAAAPASRPTKVPMNPSPRGSGAPPARRF